MLLLERRTLGESINAVALLSDGRLCSWNTEGPGFYIALEKGIFDDPWARQHLTVRYGTYAEGEVSWDEPQCVMELPIGFGYWGSGPMLVDRDGAIHLFGMRVLIWPEDIERPGRDELRCDVYHVVSRDGGDSWEGPQRIDYGHPYTGALRQAAQIDSGRILLPLEYYDWDQTEGMYCCKTCYSDDGGRTWRDDSTDLHVASGGRHSHSGANEPTLTQLGNGRIYKIIRTPGRWQYESYSDDGRTWSEPRRSRFKAPNSPGYLLRLRDGRLLFTWNNTQGPPLGGEHKEVHCSRHVLNAAVSHDDGRTWHGYREYARQALPELLNDQVSYPRMLELPDGRVLMMFNHITDAWMHVVLDYVILDPDRLDETEDRDDFEHGLDGWSTNGTAGAATVDADGGRVLRMRHTGTLPLGAARNFPIGVRGAVSFEIRRDEGSAGIDVVLDETFWRPDDRRPDAAVELALDAQALPTGSWTPVTIRWDIAAGTAAVAVGGTDRTVPIRNGRLGLSYLTLHGRATAAERGATYVRRLRVQVRHA